MGKARILIAEDEPPAQQRLVRLLKKRADIEIAGVCSDGAQAVTAIRNTHPDIVLLDIEMPEKNGFEVIAEVGVERMPLVIFVTAYDRYAIRAFEVRAIDYLLKPFEEERFNQTLNRSLERIAEKTTRSEKSAIAELLRDRLKRTDYLKRIAVSIDDRIKLIPTDRIDWIDAERNYVRLHVGKNSFLLRETINHFETQLDPDLFLRIHRSVIVNINQIDEIQTLFHGRYRAVLKDGTTLPISSGYRDRLPRTARKS